MNPGISRREMARFHFKAVAGRATCNDTFAVPACPQCAIHISEESLPAESAAV